MFKEAVSYGVAGAVGGILGSVAGIGIVIGMPVVIAYRTSGEFKETIDNAFRAPKEAKKAKKRKLAAVSEIKPENSDPVE